MRTDYSPCLMFQSHYQICPMTAISPVSVHYCSTIMAYQMCISRFAESVYVGESIHYSGGFISKFFFCLQFPSIGELLLNRLIIQFRRGFKRNDKTICISAATFIAHLVNQRVVS